MRGWMKWRTHEGQGAEQNLQQRSRLMQNGQKFLSRYCGEWKINVNEREAYSAQNL